MPAQYRIENGYLVGYYPGVAPVRTSLDQCARAAVAAGNRAARVLIGADWSDFDGWGPTETIDAFDRAWTAGAFDAVSGAFDAVSGAFSTVGADVEVGWRFLKKLKRKVKKLGKKALKATKTVMRVAHKVTHNKVFEKIHHAIQKIVPQPYKTLVDLQKPLQKATVKFVEDFSSGKKGARAIAPAIRAAAHGIISSDALAEQARKLGVPVDQVKAVAAMTKLEVDAGKGNKVAQAAKRAMEMLEDVAAGKPGQAIQVVAEAQLRKVVPGATAHNVTTKNGRRYRAILIPLPKPKAA